MPHLADETTISGVAASATIVVDGGLNFFGTSEDLIGVRVERKRHLPRQVIDSYLSAAINRSENRRLENGEWFWEIPGFDGVWASGQEPDKVAAELREVLFDWLVLKIEHEDRDIPQINGISLNTL